MWGGSQILGAHKNPPQSTFQPTWPRPEHSWTTFSSNLAFHALSDAVLEPPKPQFSHFYIAKPLIFLFLQCKTINFQDPQRLPQDLPNGTRDLPKTPQDLPKIPQDSPRSLRDLPETPPRPFQDTLRPLQDLPGCPERPQDLPKTAPRPPQATPNNSPRPPTSLCLLTLYRVPAAGVGGSRRSL